MSLLSDLKAQIEACTDCQLSRTRTRAVPGEGRENADVVFVGEGPGYWEDQQGRPFVGPAGKFLDELLQMVGLERGQVYICNVVKCRPPGNRDPLPQEINVCQKWLDRQLGLIAPKMIVTLGRYSMARYFPGESIGKIHGKPVRRDGVTYFPMHHPAAALHQQRYRQTIEEDMRKIPDLLRQAHEVAEEVPKPRQLPLI